MPSAALPSTALPITALTGLLGFFGALALVGRALALNHHVGIAAGIFDPASVRRFRARGGNGGGHRAIKEVAIMADENDGAGKARHDLLQQIERLDIKVVGRFVEDQEVRRARQDARQHQPGPLATG